ncbi:hypothetical protein G6O69_18480 [Pseudenhygromyxa sp. WMMC2535]|uniref:hypothetical protein n=1 Tax=Pseudenhygromyxa sp. WMMC2535 TaxID=2712867 RepID=UPI00155675F7|nr:hypothetical protein [Pseudenhygromyxa sp. WMMC2535]NVB39836.1 hypothetical protein [Pseudenhygromyxa sp. WMMC2535]
MKDTIDITQLGLISKPNPRDDFGLTRAHGHVSSEELELLFAWLQVHIDAGNPHSEFAVLDERGAWVLRAVDEAATDFSGRTMRHLVFGRVATRDPELLARLVFGMHLHHQPDAKASEGPSCRVELAGPTQADVGGAELGLWTMLTSSEPAVVVNPATASTVARRIGADNLAYLAVMRNTWPSRWPPGFGLAISRAQFTAPAISSELRGVDLTSLDLPALFSIAPRPETRRALVGCVGGGPIDPMWSPAALTWLVATPGGRDRAIAEAELASLAAWLDAGLIDFELVEGRLRGEPPRATAELLRGRDGALTWFVEHHGPSAAGLDLLLLDAGMPAAVCRALTGDEQLLAPPHEPPAPPASKAWAKGLEAALVWRAGVWACLDDRWHPWWRAIVEAHPQLGRAALDLDRADWSPTLVAHLEAEVRSQAIAHDRVHATLGRWRGHGAIDRREVGRLLRSLDGGPRALVDLLSDEPSDERPTTEDLDQLAAVRRVGLVVDADVMLAVTGGAATAWLRAIDVDEVALALIDPDETPPLAPPRRWDPRLDVLLARASNQRWFWRRFAGFVSAALLEWCTERLRGTTTELLLTRVLAAFDRRVDLSPSELELVHESLPAKVVCAHVMTTARSTSGPARDTALRMLLAAPAISSELRAWLSGELLEFRPRLAPPAIETSLLRELLPLLHPTREILRPLLARSTPEPGDLQLGAALADAIVRAAAPPLAAPDLAIRRRHAELLRGVGELPGWEHWRSGRE